MSLDDFVDRLDDHFVNDKESIYADAKVYSDLKRTTLYDLFRRVLSRDFGDDYNTLAIFLMKLNEMGRLYAQKVSVLTARRNRVLSNLHEFDETQDPDEVYINLESWFEENGFAFTDEQAVTKYNQFIRTQTYQNEFRNFQQYIQEHPEIYAEFLGPKGDEPSRTY